MHPRDATKSPRGSRCRSRSRTRPTRSEFFARWPKRARCACRWKRRSGRSASGCWSIASASRGWSTANSSHACRIPNRTLPPDGEGARHVKLTVLDPGHFHAALLQRKMYADIEPTVDVYAQEGPELADYVRRVEGFNRRPDNPTGWRLTIHASPDFLERFAADRRRDSTGDIVVIAGNNRRKTEYLSRAIAAGFHVLADKPMAIDVAGFRSLEQAFASAGRNKLLLYDIMTERHEITTLLQKEFATMTPVFGALA